MSTKGIYTAVSGALAQSARLDTIANNIANTNTTGFKKSKQVFNEYLTANEKLPDVIQVPRVPASIESFYDMQGGDKAFVNAAGSYVDQTQGQLKPTGNTFDLAIEGSGYFEILAPEGVRLTRDGSFKKDADGRLVTKQGFPVLSSGSGNPQSRVINIGSSNLTVSYSGEIYSAGESVGQLSLVNVTNKEALLPIGANGFSLKPNYDQTLVPSDDIKLHQGFLEGSNVNVVSEMTDMITATRAFESTQQAIKAFDSMNEKLVNIVPRLK
ncbi:MAG: flagellar basal-body rod protein FlgF [Bdellovibrionaceae bacterium]|nr:flagellar basal-body rod protein FlgF [Pseudobdellovibrionaceae bacterium]